MMAERAQETRSLGAPAFIAIALTAASGPFSKKYYQGSLVKHVFVFVGKVLFAAHFGS
jgi:hypothetical protein